MRRNADKLPQEMDCSAFARSLRCCLDTASSAANIVTMHATAPNVLTVRVPHQCVGRAFEQSYADAMSKLAAAKHSFGLVFDLRRADLLSLPLDTILSDAASIARLGYCKRCVMLIDANINMLVKSTLTLGLYLCPVQPARLFESEPKAMAWASEQLGRGKKSYAYLDEVDKPSSHLLPRLNPLPPGPAIHARDPRVECAV